MKKPSILSAMSAGILAFSTTASAVVKTLPTPPQSEEIDTESSINVPLSGWTPDTRRFFVDLAAEAGPSNAIHLAYGTDRNHDEDLEPEETDLVLGVDCGIPFLIPTDASASSTASVPASISASTNFHFVLSRHFCRDWNLVKITTRGVTNIAATVSAIYRNNPTFIYVR